MSKNKQPVTPAMRVLRAAGISYTGHPYAYEEHGGTAVCARELNVDEHAVVKTLIMEDEKKNPFVVLMHGDLKVSAKALARTLGVKSVSSCHPEKARKHTGYEVGGTSPFGTRKEMPVYMEESIMELRRIYINGGKKGYLVAMSPADAAAVLRPVFVNVGLASDSFHDL